MTHEGFFYKKKCIRLYLTKDPFKPWRFLAMLGMTADAFFCWHDKSLFFYAFFATIAISPAPF